MWHYNKKLIGIMIEHVEDFFMCWNKVILSIYHLEIPRKNSVVREANFKFKYFGLHNQAKLKLTIINSIIISN